MKNYFWDIETTNLNVFSAEPITAYFVSEDGTDDLYVELKPDSWFKEAEKVHGISKKQAMGFSSKILGIKKILGWMKERQGTYWCHANKNNFGSTYLYDYAVLKNETRKLQMNTGTRWYYSFLEVFEVSGNYSFESTHTLSKEKLSLKKNDLASLCKYYNIEQKAHHTAKDDVIVTRELYKRLISE